MKIVGKLFHYLCILVFLLVLSCQKDTITENRKEEALHTKYTFKSSIVFLKDIENNAKLHTKVRSLSTSEQHQIGKNIYNATYNFTVDMHVAKFIENTNDNTHSYTFSISRDTTIGSSVENLVFSYDALADDYKASLVTYHFSDAQRQEFVTTSHVSSPYTITYETIQLDWSEVLNKNETPCVVTFQEFHQPDGSNNWFLHSVNGQVQNACEHENDDDPCETYTMIDIYCPDGGSTGTTHSTSDHTSSTNTSNNATNGGSGGDSGSNDRLVTSPILRSIDTILDCMNQDSFNPTITSSTESWLEANRDYASQISAYILDKGCDETSQDFVEEAIIALVNNAEVNFEEEIILDPTFVGKARCIYDRLQNTSTSFKDLLKRFDGEFPVSHLTYKVDNSLVQGNYGLTEPPQNFNITVAFSNTQLANISDLGAAVCFAHEMIHAEIFRKMMEAAKQGNLSPSTMTTQQQIDYVNSLRDNFPGIYDYYIQRYKPTWNHEMMAQHYRTVIADILEEFDNSSKPRAVYESLSWVGLRVLEDLNNSTAWDALTDAERQTVINHLNTYFINGDNTCN